MSVVGKPVSPPDQGGEARAAILQADIGKTPLGCETETVSSHPETTKARRMNRRAFENNG
ncbi:hypothetical protein [Caulobacter sp. RHG1]|uniref:hypothetical protein n=1 Tax=Caulobacter sp. (strain RHG1) TaxID=2545762 RepID=UPI0015562D1F|nr:hypothetical protein [Caulobacter sp. RHG1]